MAVKGLPADKISPGESLGILGMHERALVFGGEVIISSTLGMGTTVKVRMREACCT
jgi:signal transduction histidine kinase